jgi:hypothetical protein
MEDLPACQVQDTSIFCSLKEPLGIISIFQGIIIPDDEKKR